MRDIEILKEYLEIQSKIPTSAEEQKKWLGLDDALNFLLGSRERMIPIYVSCKNFFVYSLVVSEEKLHSDYVKDLLGWNFEVSRSGYGYYSSDHNGKREPSIDNPMDSTGTDILNGSTPIFFMRIFEGHNPSCILEINQKISHVLGIFWLEDRNAFCKFNEMGDYENIATMDRGKNFTLCTLKKEDLDFYLFLSRSILIRVFEFSRSLDRMKYLNGSKRKEDFYKNPQEETFANRTTEFNKKNEATTAWFRGFQIIRNTISHEEMMKKLDGKEDRIYASFIISDWKNKKICEWSSDPKQHGNYFVKSDLPFGTSPAFFKPEVLAKYKQDPSKYTIGSRHITCRQAWFLNYDVNEEGQVHVYICDLSYLPYQEQLYWRSFNEKPKAGISKRAFKTDFEACWDFDYDPLISLKQILEEFPVAKAGNEELPIWKMPNSPETRDVRFLNYVITDSVKEWDDQILTLAQILVDGLCANSIKKLAENLKCRDTNLGSLKQLIKCLEKLGVSNNDISIFSDSLITLWKFRSSIVAHVGGEYPKGDLKEQYRDLIEKCDKAMRKLADFIKDGTLDI